MYTCVKLNNKNIKYLEKLNSFKDGFNDLNMDFFRVYNSINILKKIFERKRITLLKSKDNYYVGYIWINQKEVHCFNIQAMNVVPNNDLIQCYKELITTVPNKSKLFYECRKNKDNFRILEEVGFKKMEGTFEMCCLLNNDFQYESLLTNNISIEKMIRNEEENIRCEIQNAIFKSPDRIPLSIEDIYYDESQNYFYEDGCFFFYKNGKAVGYGQIIIENQKPIIVNFGILPEHRGLGYGKAFLKYLLNYAKSNKFNEIYIKVDSNNNIAMNLYRSLGFKLIGEVYKWELDKN